MRPGDLVLHDYLQVLHQVEGGHEYAVRTHIGGQKQPRDQPIDVKEWEWDQQGLSNPIRPGTHIIALHRQTLQYIGDAVLVGEHYPLGSPSSATAEGNRQQIIPMS